MSIVVSSIKFSKLGFFLNEKNPFFKTPIEKGKLQEIAKHRQRDGIFAFNSVNILPLT
jgi:hypothetical protein